MAFERVGPKPLDYKPVQYGTSKLVFRGPKRILEGDYIACLGGTETYGKFINRPFPDLLDRDLPVPCVNFGWANAGVDVFLKDAGLLLLAQSARAVVLQIPSAMNLSNPYYLVHPRRNDRFVQAAPRLKRLYPEIDFTEFHFTRHLMWRLSDIAPQRFAVLRRALQEVWILRMQQLIERIGRPVVLLWFAGHAPRHGEGTAELYDDPAFVSRAMLQAVSSRAARLVEVVISREARAQGTRGMRFAAMEAAVAADLPGLLAHSEVAHALGPVLSTLLSE
ncbi:MAG: hypothetical protein COW54_13385 [Rhodobacteraceae bacterium CG17_big_fil_post_rev_8_21_14_2_50_63_15]|nr:hypothetical protein [Roseovarius sp.]PIV77685.1 MAG: hypothetical protein COW54_13385 [Rhodobacteraceae bacterium CG17_big_fil_post_rev_8_21_14_2_50_63_15]